MAQTVKNLPAMRETWVRFLGWEDPWSRAWQPTLVFLPGESPCTDEPGGLQSMGSQRVGCDWATKYTHSIVVAKHKHVQTNHLIFSFLAFEMFISVFFFPLGGGQKIILSL